MEQPVNHVVREHTPHWQAGIWIVAAAIPYAGIVELALRTTTLLGPQAPVTLVWAGMAWLIYLSAIWYGEKVKAFPEWAIFGGALLFHLLLWPAPPTLSDDVYRYLWEGHLGNLGVSPYAFPIDAPQLDAYAHPVRELTSHRWMASPYLPGAQSFFRMVTWVGGTTPLAMQIAASLAALAAGLLVLRLLRVVGAPSGRVLLLLWNPLFVIEAAHGAHLDAWMLLLLLGALTCVYGVIYVGRRMEWIGRAASVLLLAMATLTKGLPVVALAVIFWRWRWWQIALFGGGVGLLLATAAQSAGWGLSGELDGQGLFGALRIYAAQWKYNSGLFVWLEQALAGGQMVEALHTRQAKQLVAVAMVLVGLWVWLQARRQPATIEALRLVSVLLATHVLLAPTMHPWYLVTLLGFLPFLAPLPQEPQRQWLWVLPWLYLSGALFLSYVTYIRPDDLREYPWVRWSEWLPTVVLLALAAGQAVLWRATRWRLAGGATSK
jgi:alpha-1,6-mannosyltransferase